MAMGDHRESKRIIRLLWILVGLTLAIAIVVNFALGWGILNQRDSQRRIFQEKITLADREAEIRKFQGLNVSTVRITLDPNRNMEGASGLQFSASLKHAIDVLLNTFPEEKKDGHGATLVQMALELEKLTQKSIAWRRSFERVYADVSLEKTLERARGHFFTVHEEISRLTGRERLRAAQELRRFDEAPERFRDSLANSVILTHRNMLKSFIADFQREMADLQRLVEILGKETSHDRLSDIRDNQLKPNFERLDRDNRLLAKVNPESARIVQAELEALRTALFGIGYVIDQDHQTIQMGEGGLYNLRRSYLDLVHEEREMERELDLLVLGFEQDFSLLLQDVQGRLEDRENRLQGDLSETWLYVFLLSMVGVVFFLFLIGLIFRGISQQVDLLAKLRREAETSNEVKGKFLASMSHELRTPLNAIIGFSEMMRQKAFGPLGSSKYVEYVEDIHLSGRHLLEIIDDILDVSSIEAGKFEITETEFDLAAAVNDALQMVLIQAREAGIILRNDMVEEALPIYADQRLIRQIIVNLLSNAVKFTQDGGVVSVGFERLPDGGFILQVTDTGIGMDEDGIATALTPFGMVQNAYDSRHRGTGLGLPLAKNMMELHGGRLEVQSEPGAGTQVTLVFPAFRLLQSTGAIEGSVTAPSSQ
ncbi:sensor histidine kinase [Aestuariispira insulae]|uniref:histidine kinase n=1 Tax=Aestuariispira insulae TaxID=1461337 RepID=A0A3D9HX62_9PROT|nr:ATP-binding protein [Aestuariispira insulae]RED54009.1 signal transduction histidine kinase [Aestuariispira insulae]